MPKTLLSAVALAAALLVSPAFAVQAAEPFAPAPVAVQQTGWWSMLGDAQLSALVERGLAANLDVAQAQARIAQSRALLAGARAALGPSGSVGLQARAAQASESEAPGMGRAQRRGDSVGALLEFSWEADLFGRQRDQAGAASERVRSSQAQLDAVRLAVAGEIAHAYFSLIGAREQLQLARTVHANRVQTLGLVRTRLAAGLARPLDEARAAAESEAAQAEIPGHEAEERVALHRIAVLTGTSPTGFELRTPDRQPASMMALRIPDGAQWLAHRPDIRQLESELRARALDVSALRAEFYPRLTITGVLGFIAGSFTGLGSGGSLSWLGSPSLFAPLFDRPRIQARLDAATAGQKEVLAAYEQRLLLATEEVANAMARHDAGQRQLQALHRQAAHATDAERLAGARYRGGASDLLELLDAQRTARQAQRALAEALMLQRQHFVAVLKGLGGITPLG
ncbi:efflux transporter outer membrane subunit [Ramlibacter sp. AN1133]|uniref:efflux transporter outer membrane subunit n=1 Tax=Ramlibacter sp. AN1133 TaxID=3133429 RepID=UPI0030C38B51